MDKNLTSEHAKALSAKGASKGGKARARKLSPQDRQEIAIQAAETRWGITIPRATHSGDLEIAGRKISCAVLENGKRLLTQRTFLTAIGRSKSPAAGTGSGRLVSEEGLPPFLAAENLTPFISPELRELTSPLVFRTAKGIKAYGFEARLLPMVCEVYLKLRDSSVRYGNDQERVIGVCDLLMRGLAQVGITALVDEATGYQKDRDRDELRKILTAYINEELRGWVAMFPEEFFKQVYRLHNWEYRAGDYRRPQYIGKFINRYIYEQLPHGVLNALQEKNPITEKGWRKYKHHQYLTEETGNPHLDKQIATIITVMRVSDNKEDFERNFSKAFNKHYQLALPAPSGDD